MKPQILRHLIIALLMLTGVFHLAIALLGGAGAYGAGVAIMGVVYSGLGFWVRRDVTMLGDAAGRHSIIGTVAITSLVLAVGGGYYLTNGGPGVLAFLFLIDVAIIGAGALWLFQTYSAKTR
ncbi:MAG: hypothetical protein AAGA09_02125 [Pseudomonadota bacterium]